MNTEPSIKNMIFEIVDKIKEEYQPDKIILFGSYAYGHPDRDSDIDFLIIKDTPERHIDRMAEVTKIASDPRRLIPLEVIVLTPGEISERLQVGDQFVREILDKGEILYEASRIPQS